MGGDHLTRELLPGTADRNATSSWNEAELIRNITGWTMTRIDCFMRSSSLQCGDDDENLPHRQEQLFFAQKARQYTSSSDGIGSTFVFAAILVFLYVGADVFMSDVEEELEEEKNMPDEPMWRTVAAH